MQQQATQQQNPHLVMKILWAALAGTQLLLVFIANMQPRPVDPVFTDTIKYTLMMVAVGTLFAAFALPMFLGKSVRANLEKQGKSVDAMPLEQVAQKAIVPFILRCAFLDSVTIMGFLLSFMSGDMTYVFGFAAVALVGFALSFPSERNVRGFLG